MHGQARRTQCALHFAEQISIQIANLIIERAVIAVAFAVNSICLPLLDVAIERSVGIICPDYMVEINHSVFLREDPLADRAREDGVDLEFQPITVQLIVGLDFRPTREIVNVP